MTYRRVSDWMIGFIDTVYIQLVTIINYSSIAISTLYISLLHYCPQSSLVVSWQRIHNRLTVTAAHYEVFVAQPNSFLAISSQLFCRLPTLSSNSGCLRSSLYSLGADPTENIASSVVAC
jgi:hypothetical protein